MKSISFWLAFGFGLLLPLHGGITVFLPDLFRFWKEALLVILGVWVVLDTIKWMATQRPNPTQLEHFLNLRSPLPWAGLFLLWLGALMLYRGDAAAIYATRYLALFPLTLIVVNLFLRRHEAGGLGFLLGIIAGGFVSVLFGIWMKYLGGLEPLTNFYSQTISSWVPGQTIPLYHEVHGSIRMQGLGSGPVEFSYILLSSVLATLGFWNVLNRLWLKVLGGVILAVFGFGIIESGSRGAFLGLMLLLIAWASKPYWPVLKNKFLQLGLILMGLVCFIGMVLFTLDHPGTIDHFNRPIQGLEMSLNSPVVGQLATIGPAARWYNLEYNGSDKAFITENVWVDILVQTGFLGLGIMLIMLCLAWQRLAGVGRLWLLLMIMVTQLATVFDMTPVSISYAFMLAILLESNMSRIQNVSEKSRK